MLITPSRALQDKRLLGAAMGGDLTSWQTWLVVLKAAFGQLFTGDALGVFRAVAGDRPPPAQRIRELWCVCGRRSGKSRMAAACGVSLALFEEHHLAPAETGIVAIVATTKEQAGVIFDYVRGFL